MENYVYALYIDGELKYDKRNELMSTNDPLFPFLKNCMYGPKVDFIKDDGSYSFGIKLIDYGFVINKNQTVIPLSPGSIIEGPIKKIDFQNTKQVFYQNNMPINEQITNDTINESVCPSIDDGLQASFGIMGDDMIFQQEDIELEEEIVSLQKNEDETSLLVKQDEEQSKEMLKYQNEEKSSDTINYQDQNILFKDNKESISSPYSECEEQFEDNLSNIKKNIELSSKYKVKSKMKSRTKINTDIKDVANALVNFSSINDRMLLEKNKEGIEEAKVLKTKNHRKIKGSKLRKHGRKPLRLNILAKEKVQNSDTEIAENDTSNADIKLTEKYTSIVNQSISNDKDFANNSISQLEESLKEALTSEMNVSHDFIDKLITIENNIQVDSELKIISEFDNCEKQFFSNDFKRDTIRHDELNQLNDSNVKTPDFKTIVDDILKNQDTNVNSETETGVKTIDENNIYENEKDADSKLDISINNSNNVYDVIGVINIMPILKTEQKDVERLEDSNSASIIDMPTIKNKWNEREIESNCMEQPTNNLILPRFIYNLNYNTKKKYAEPINEFSILMAQRLKEMEEERRLMQDEIRQEELRLARWEKDIACRERNKIKRRSKRKK